MKKLLSLFVLLVAIVTGAQAEELFSGTLPNFTTETSYSRSSGSKTVTGGTLSWSAINSGNKTIGGNVYWKFDSSTYVQLKLSGDAKFQAGDVVTVDVGNQASSEKPLGYFLHSASGKGPESVSTAGGTATTIDYTLKEADIESDGSIKIYRINSDARYYGFSVSGTRSTTPPAITTDLPATAGVTVGVAEDFSIVATGATSYQWYKDDVAIEGATAATYSYTAAAAGTVNIKCVASNTYGDTPSKVCAVTATAPANPPVITTNLEAAYNVIKGQTKELSIVAEDASSYQWYLDGVAVEGATTDTYTFTAGSTIGATNEVYCAAINAAGTTNSATATITTVGRADCKLLQVKYSNNFYAFIKQPTTERPDDPYTITSYYLEGETAPTIESESVTVSDGATWAVDGNTLTVTAEDETTTAEFTINTPVAVSPYTGLGEYTFTADDTWVKTGYAFDTTSGKKGWKFSKNDESDGKLRNADGRTRIYLFVGPSKTIKLTSGCSSDRDIRVYRNGTEVLAKTKLAKNGGTVTFDGDEDNAAMYEVRSAQTGGDGSIEKITIATSTEPVAIPSEGVATYVTKQALDFSTQNGTIKAYAVTAVSTTSATTAVVGQVPAGTPLLVKGAEGSYDIEVIASAEAITNLLLASDGTVQGGDNIYAYSKSALKFKKVSGEVTIPAGKAYLQTTAGDALDIVFEDEATAVEAIAEADAEAAAPVKVIKNGKLYIGNFNVAGQQVK